MTIKKEYTITMTGKELADLLELIDALKKGEAMTEDYYDDMFTRIKAYEDALWEQGYYDK